MAGKLIRAAIIIAAAVCAYWLVVIIHEAGHVCMGLLTGSSFVYFRIGSFMIYKNQGKLKITRLNIPGTLGQGIMMPEECEEPSMIKGVLYHGGGGFFNLLTALIILVTYPSVQNTYFKAFMIILGALSLALGLINLVPSNITVPSDGYNMRALIRSKADRKAIHQMLRILGYTDCSPSEIPLREFVVPEEGEFAPAMKLMKGEYYLDAGNLAEAEELFAQSARKDTPNITFYRLLAEKDLLYCLLMRNADDSEITSLVDEELRASLENKADVSISRHRTLYAYYHLFTKEEDKAKAEYEEAMRMIARQPDSSDGKMEMKLLEAVKNM